jgi:hypothetical protein
MGSPRWSVLFAFTFAFACGSPPPSELQREFETLRDEARSRNTLTRASGAGSLVMLCCDHDILHPTRNPASNPYLVKACNEVRRLLETETEPLVMQSLITWNIHTDPRPHCYADFPSSVVVRLCRSGCGAFARGSLASMLGQLDPSPEIVAALVHQLEVPDDPSLEPALNDLPAWQNQLANEEYVDSHVAGAISKAGEPDLGIVVAALGSPSPRVRRGAAQALYLAKIWGPLEMPELIPAFEKLDADPDLKIADMARSILVSLRSDERRSSEEQVAVLAEKAETRDRSAVLEVIRMLAVRRFSCRTTTAVDALTHLSRDADRRIAAAVRRAITLRAERCARPRP